MNRSTKPLRFSRGLLAKNLPLLPRRLQLAVAVRVDFLLVPRQHVLRRDVAYGMNSLKSLAMN